MTALDPAAREASVPEPNRAAWNGLQEAVARYHLAIAVEGGMIVLWVLLRMSVDVESTLYITWVAVACAIAFISPTSGLVVLMGTAPFFELASLATGLGMRHMLVAALGISVAIRIAAGGWRSMNWTAPVRMAIALGAVAALGVLNTWRLFPSAWAAEARNFWLASIGGAMIVLVVGVWVANMGVRRHVVVVVVASTIAVSLALVELLAPGSVSTSPLAWIGYWEKDFHGRLTGPIASPNGMAALAVMPVCVMTAVAVLGRGLPLRLLATAGAAVLFVAMYLTYSRAALLSLFGVVVVVAWRLHRLLGVAVLGAGIMAGVILLPTYLQLRAAGGSAGAAEPGSLLVATDYQRINGWGSAVAMFRDEPLIGQGFLSYKQLADLYGDPILSSPHNEWLRLFAEEGVIGGFLGLAFVATTLSWLSHGRGVLAAGILAGTLGYLTMATFNNPFLFIEVSLVVYPLIAFAIVHVSRQRSQDAVDTAETETGPGISGPDLRPAPESSSR